MNAERLSTGALMRIADALERIADALDPRTRSEIVRAARETAARRAQSMRFRDWYDEVGKPASDLLTRKVKEWIGARLQQPARGHLVKRLTRFLWLHLAPAEGDALLRAAERVDLDTVSWEGLGGDVTRARLAQVLEARRQRDRSGAQDG